MYINCHSYYSLRYGTLSVERLCELAAAAGVQRLVLTDINNIRCDVLGKYNRRLI